MSDQYLGVRERMVRELIAARGVRDDLTAFVRAMRPGLPVSLSSEVDPAWLPAAALRTTVEVAFDAGRERAVAWKRTRFEDLILSEAEAPPPPAEAERVLVEAATGQLDRALALDDPGVLHFLARVRCLREWMPELGLPGFRAKQLSTHYFSRLVDDPDQMTDLPAAQRQRFLAGGLLCARSWRE